jgi:hypothetical protein
MCRIEHVFHACGCWGPNRFVDICIRSRRDSVTGIEIGCGYHETIGMANIEESCIHCIKLGPKATLWSTPLKTWEELCCAEVPVVENDKTEERWCEMTVCSEEEPKDPDPVWITTFEESLKSSNSSRSSSISSSASMVDSVHDVKQHQKHCMHCLHLA